MIEARALTRVFERRKGKGKREWFPAVNGVSFSVREGEIVGILGPNGAGKTTLLRMLGGLMKPTSGQVLITDREGKELKSDQEKKEALGYLSENTRLYRRLSVRETLLLFAGLHGLSQKEAVERAEQTIKILSLSDFIDNRVDRLSTGQMQRASIARCLVSDPMIYIFDEPTLGLDVISARGILDFMRSERERGKTVLYSTHYMEEAEFLCDRIIMLDRGSVIADGSPKDLMGRTGGRNLREVFFILTDRTGKGSPNGPLLREGGRI